MANPTTATITPTQETATYMRRNGLDSRKQKALLVMAKALTLKGIGGTDYTTNLPQLTQDSESLFLSMDQDETMATVIKIAYANATASGGTVPATLAAKLAQVALYMTRTESDMDQDLAYLECLLGAHKAYPQ